MTITGTIKKKQAGNSWNESRFQRTTGHQVLSCR